VVCYNQALMPELPLESFEIFARGLDHPEGLAFDARGFLWAGGEAGQVYRIDAAGNVETVANLGCFCAGLAFSPSGELFVCSVGRGIVRVGPDGTHETFADRADGRPIVCPNFPLFARDGTLWVTDSGEWKKRNGSLLRFSPDGRGEIAAGPFGYANGLALDHDERQLFMVESDTDSVHRFELDGGGRLGPPELYASDVGRFPDGAALDAAGNLLVCCYASDEIHRITPGGVKTLYAWDRNAILLGGPTNIAFGGPALEQLYVANLCRTTITRAHTEARGQPLAGGREGPR
jgi:gluconolactonase